MHHYAAEISITVLLSAQNKHYSDYAGEQNARYAVRSAHSADERTVATDGDSRITCVLFSGAPRWRVVCLRNQKAKNTFHFSIIFQEIKNRTRFRPAISDEKNQGNISLSST